ncbi:hypothetical protein [Puniceibacterium sediminis]|uniref:Uncharacterized protein n=1 Tax=Puniceibacterium sediminis TaxID=1608407 RepID=A0A238YLS1_9RHOB|nr:hypothetical protein [Puniceibacterium sediminis]SNR71990.1 hypothetical protein SAMN06265370_11823 [Puniceibacterium sediminis]
MQFRNAPAPKQTLCFRAENGRRHNPENPAPPEPPLVLVPEPPLVLVPEPPLVLVATVRSSPLCATPDAAMLARAFE